MCGVSCILKEERKELENLLDLLDKQYKYIMKKEVLQLEALVDKIKHANKNVALKEVERRKVVGTKSMIEIVNKSKDVELESEYREIKKLLEGIKLQKETNELLIKQRISYNNQILSIINPKRENKTYNSYGNLKK